MKNSLFQSVLAFIGILWFVVFLFGHDIINAFSHLHLWKGIPQ